MLTCTKCKNTKDFSFFSKDKYKTTGYRSHCKECSRETHLKRYAKDPQGQRNRTNEYRRKLKEQNPEKLSLNNKKNRLKRTYGISYNQYVAMKEAQFFSCFICNVSEESAGSKGLVVDHCHETGKVRKLLCSKCNTSLGLVDENCDILEKMIAYLKAHQYKEETNG